MNFLDKTQNHQKRALRATECKFVEKFSKCLTLSKHVFFSKEDQHCGKIADIYSKI